MPNLKVQPTQPPLSRVGCPSIHLLLRCSFGLSLVGYGMLNPDNTVLLIVDVQERLAPVMHNHESLVSRMVILAQGCEALGIPVLITEQLPDKLGPTLSELSDCITDFEPYHKSAFSCCGCDEVQKELDALGREDVILAGIETHVCIYQTSMDLLSQGKGVHLVADAVTSRSPDSRQIALQRLSQEGVRMTTTEMLLFELMRDAAHPAFKTILGLVK